MDPSTVCQKPPLDSSGGRTATSQAARKPATTLVAKDGRPRGSGNTGTGRPTGSVGGQRLTHNRQGEQNGGELPRAGASSTAAAAEPGNLNPDVSSATAESGAPVSDGAASTRSTDAKPEALTLGANDNSTPVEKVSLQVLLCCYFYLKKTCALALTEGDAAPMKFFTLVTAQPLLPPGELASGSGGVEIGASPPTAPIHVPTASPQEQRGETGSFRVPPRQHSDNAFMFATRAPCLKRRPLFPTAEASEGTNPDAPSMAENLASGAVKGDGGKTTSSAHVKACGGAGRHQLRSLNMPGGAIGGAEMSSQIPGLGATDTGGFPAKARPNATLTNSIPREESQLPPWRRKERPELSSAEAPGCISSSSGIGDTTAEDVLTNSGRIKAPLLRAGRSNPSGPEGLRFFPPEAGGDYPTSLQTPSTDFLKLERVPDRRTRTQQLDDPRPPTALSTTGQRPTLTLSSNDESITDSSGAGVLEPLAVRTSTAPAPSLSLQKGGDVKKHDAQRSTCGRKDTNDPASLPPLPPPIPKKHGPFCSKAVLQAGISLNASLQSSSKAAAADYSTLNASPTNKVDEGALATRSPSPSPHGTDDSLILDGKELPSGASEREHSSLPLIPVSTSTADPTVASATNFLPQEDTGHGSAENIIAQLLQQLQKSKELQKMTAADLLLKLHAIAASAGVPLSASSGDNDSAGIPAPKTADRRLNAMLGNHTESQYPHGKTAASGPFLNAPFSATEKTGTAIVSEIFTSANRDITGTSTPTSTGLPSSSMWPTIRSGYSESNSVYPPPAPPPMTSRMTATTLSGHGTGRSESPSFIRNNHSRTDFRNNDASLCLGTNPHSYPLDVGLSCRRSAANPTSAAYASTAASNSMHRQQHPQHSLQQHVSTTAVTGNTVSSSHPFLSDNALPHSPLDSAPATADSSGGTALLPSDVLRALEIIKQSPESFFPPQGPVSRVDLTAKKASVPAVSPLGLFSDTSEALTASGFRKRTDPQQPGDSTANPSVAGLLMPNPFLPVATDADTKGPFLFQRAAAVAAGAPSPNATVWSPSVPPTSVAVLNPLVSPNSTAHLRNDLVTSHPASSHRSLSSASHSFLSGGPKLNSSVTSSIGVNSAGATNTAVGRSCWAGSTVPPALPSSDALNAADLKDTLPDVGGSVCTQNLVPQPRLSSVATSFSIRKLENVRDDPSSFCLPQSLHERVWEYRDPTGQIQGPFSALQMSSWWEGQFFPDDLLMRYNACLPWVPFKTLFPRHLYDVLPPFSKFPTVHQNGTVSFPFLLMEGENPIFSSRLRGSMLMHHSPNTTAPSRGPYSVHILPSGAVPPQTCSTPYGTSLRAVPTTTLSADSTNEPSDLRARGGASGLTNGTLSHPLPSSPCSFGDSSANPTASAAALLMTQGLKSILGLPTGKQTTVSPSPRTTAQPAEPVQDPKFPPTESNTTTTAHSPTDIAALSSGLSTSKGVSRVLTKNSAPVKAGPVKAVTLAQTSKKTRSASFVPTETPLGHSASHTSARKKGLQPTASSPTASLLLLSPQQPVDEIQAPVQVQSATTQVPDCSSKGQPSKPKKNDKMVTQASQHASIVQLNRSQPSLPENQEARKQFKSGPVTTTARLPTANGQASSTTVVTTGPTLDADNKGGGKASTAPQPMRSRPKRVPWQILPANPAGNGSKSTETPGASLLAWNDDEFPDPAEALAMQQKGSRVSAPKTNGKKATPDSGPHSSTTSSAVNTFPRKTKKTLQEFLKEEATLAQSTHKSAWNCQPPTEDKNTPYFCTASSPTDPSLDESVLKVYSIVTHGYLTMACGTKSSVPGRAGSKIPVSDGPSGASGGFDGFSGRVGDPVPTVPGEPSLAPKTPVSGSLPPPTMTQQPDGHLSTALGGTCSQKKSGQPRGSVTLNPGEWVTVSKKKSVSAMAQARQNGLVAKSGEGAADSVLRASVFPKANGGSTSTKTPSVQGGSAVAPPSASRKSSLQLHHHTSESTKNTSLSSTESPVGTVPTAPLSHEQLFEIQKLMKHCHITLDPTMVDFLKDFKQADTLVDILKDNLADKTHLQTFAVEFVEICQNPFTTVTCIKGAPGPSGNMVSLNGHVYQDLSKRKGSSGHGSALAQPGTLMHNPASLKSKEEKKPKKGRKAKAPQQQLA